MFGYEEGAFTGATRGGRIGLFELAHGGTLFLDEIGEISFNFQAKLLRVLQEKEIRRVGGDRIIPIDVRIICATNKSLYNLVKKGGFREDLYYRLSILELNLIPLRERKDDISPLAVSFLRTEMDKENRHLHWKNENVFTPLKDYYWRGNARELQNFIHKLVICAPNSEVTSAYLRELFEETAHKENIMDKIEVTVSSDFKSMESELWQKLLDKHHGDRVLLCRTYGISKTTLWRKLNLPNE